MDKNVDEMLASLPPEAFVNHGRFAPKLSFEQRCEMLALYRADIGRSVLASVFNVDRRTVTHVHNDKSPHYKKIRAEEKRLGPDEFRRTYITEATLARIAELTHAFGQKAGADRLASRSAGVHIVETEMTSKPHRIIIQWHEEGIDGGPRGWYYQDADGAAPEQWLHNGEASVVTSMACLQAAKESLFDT